VPDFLLAALPVPTSVLPVTALALNLDDELGEVAARAADLIGIFAFALSGALLAVRKNMDVLGIIVLAVATGLGGGIVRDLLIGSLPPVALTDPGYFWTPVAAAGVVFFLHVQVARINSAVYFFDAAGLGVFCVTGTAKAFHYGLSPVSAVVLGVMTAVGGGVIRDLLAQESPSLLRWDREVYAVPAMVGAVIAVVLLVTGQFNGYTGTLAALTAFLLRLLALRYHWRAPRAIGVRRRVTPAENESDW
jgi:uncharacterized membrane protein YeiH